MPRTKRAAPPKRAKQSRTSKLKRRRLTRTTALMIASVVAVGLYLFSWVIRDLSQSLFFQPPDRVNIVVYDEVPTFYSLGVREVGNYALPLYPDLRIKVPGGYGFYRVGALGKLVELEDDPDLLRRSFAAVSSSYVTHVFYERSDEVFYGDNELIDQNRKPSMTDILFMESSASLADRIFILTLLNRIQPNSVFEIDYLPYDTVQDDTIFDPITFFEELVGTFYQKTYRTENLNVQIMYTESYATADMISAILNGNGIIVGDLSQEESEYKDCTIIEETTDRRSQTAKSIAEYFGCQLKTGKTGIYDIQFILGPLEEEWEIR